MTGTQAKILLVDDDASAIRAAGKMLADYPNQRFARSGLEALRMAKEDRPDLIILDVDMPGMSGFSVCEALRADRELSKVPVIMATSLDGIMVGLLSKQRGANDVVIKPLEPADFRARVTAQLASDAPAMHCAVHASMCEPGREAAHQPASGSDQGSRAPHRSLLGGMLEMVRQMRVDADSPLSSLQEARLNHIEMGAMEMERLLADPLYVEATGFGDVH